MKQAMMINLKRLYKKRMSYYLIMVSVSVFSPFIDFKMLLNFLTSSSLSKRGSLNNLNNLVPGPESIIYGNGKTDKKSIINQPVR